jgi:hypothetical protein
MFFTPFFSVTAKVASFPLVLDEVELHPARKRALRFFSVRNN